MRALSTLNVCCPKLGVLTSPVYILLAGLFPCALFNRITLAPPPCYHRPPTIHLAPQPSGSSRAPPTPATCCGCRQRVSCRGAVPKGSSSSSTATSISIPSRSCRTAGRCGRRRRRTALQLWINRSREERRQLPRSPRRREGRTTRGRLPFSPRTIQLRLRGEDYKGKAPLFPSHHPASSQGGGRQGEGSPFPLAPSSFTIGGRATGGGPPSSPHTTQLHHRLCSGSVLALPPAGCYS